MDFYLLKVIFNNSYGKPKKGEKKLRENLGLTSFGCFTLVEDQALEFLCHAIDFINTFFLDDFPCLPSILFSFMFTLTTTIPAKISL
jgi:hypothetical protein